MEKRHEKPKEQVDMVRALEVKHFISILREENLDLFEELRSFKKAVSQGFKDIFAGQEELRGEIQQIVKDYSELKKNSSRMEDGKSESSTRLDEFQGQLNKIESQQCLIHKAIQTVQSKVNSGEDNPSAPSDDPGKPIQTSDDNAIIVQQNCSQCDFSCENIRDLRNHMRRIHSKRCEKCDFTIHSEEQQNKHMMIRHDGEDGVLWVADSILSNVDFDFLSWRIKKKVKHVKAYI